jgi:hypothetical protein
MAAMPASAARGFRAPGHPAQAAWAETLATAVRRHQAALQRSPALAKRRVGAGMREGDAVAAPLISSVGSASFPKNRFERSWREEAQQGRVKSDPIASRLRANCFGMDWDAVQDRSARVLRLRHCRLQRADVPDSRSGPGRTPLIQGWFSRPHSASGCRRRCHARAATARCRCPGPAERPAAVPWRRAAPHSRACTMRRCHTR